MTVTQSVEEFLDLTLDDDDDDDDDDCSDSDDCDDDDVVIVQDLKIMQQALKESEDRYRELAVRVPLELSPPATPEKSRLNSVGGHAAAASSSSSSFQPPSSSTGLGHEDDKEDGSLDELFRLRAKVMNLEAEVERLTEVLEAEGKAELARCDSMPQASKCECTYRSKRHIFMGEWFETCLFFLCS